MRGKYKYYYNDEPAIEYCKKHPEYKYNHLTKYISDGLRADSSKTEQELINEFFSKPHKKYHRFIVNGMNLKKACEAENKSYTAVTKDISRSKDNEEYSGMTEDERINKVLEKHLLGEGVVEIPVEGPNKLVLKLDTKKNK